MIKRTFNSQRKRRHIVIHQKRCKTQAYEYQYEHPRRLDQHIQYSSSKNNTIHISVGKNNNHPLHNLSIGSKVKIAEVVRPANASHAITRFIKRKGQQLLVSTSDMSHSYNLSQFYDRFGKNYRISTEYQNYPNPKTTQTHIIEQHKESSISQAEENEKIIPEKYRKLLKLRQMLRSTFNLNSHSTSNKQEIEGLQNTVQNQRFSRFKFNNQYIEKCLSTTESKLGGKEYSPLQRLRVKRNSDKNSMVNSMYKSNLVRNLIPNIFYQRGNVLVADQIAQPLQKEQEFLQKKREKRAGSLKLRFGQTQEDHSPSRNQSNMKTRSSWCLEAWSNDEKIPFRQQTTQDPKTNAQHRSN